MELHQLRYFVAVAEEGSFTRAAEKLFLAQPSLSVQIRKLEQDVGAKLFERMSRQVVLTAAGEVFLDSAVRALAEMERGRERVEEVVGLRRGRISVGVLPSVGAHLLPSVLAAFREQHGAVAVNIVEHDVFRDFEQMVTGGELDLAMTRMPVSRPGLGAEILIREPMVLLVPPDHPLCDRESVRLAELADENFIGMRRGYGLRELADQLCGEAASSPGWPWRPGSCPSCTAWCAPGWASRCCPGWPREGHRAGWRCRIPAPSGSSAWCGGRARSCHRRAPRPGVAAGVGARGPRAQAIRVVTWGTTVAESIFVPAYSCANIRRR